MYLQWPGAPEAGINPDQETNASMIGSTIGHYRILNKLGEGGMGVVYKAEDTRLHRPVALKFLPPHVADSDADRARFLQEARAAAALSHANICTIHGIEEQDGHIFIVMEFVDGVTLRGMLPSTIGKPQTVLPIAQQIGDALREAHARGIVHRDIKAENIMVTPKGQVKVMDFGLAKLRGS